MKRLSAVRKADLIALSVAIGLAPALAAAADERTSTRANFKDPDAIAAVHEGRSEVANAAWWGFDPQDATAAVQAAIDSGAPEVVVPYMGMDWIVGPLVLESDQKILFEPGVVVTAKEGAFRGEQDSLLTGTGVRNVTISGYGAVLRMRKADYATKSYTPSATRHAFALYGVNNVRVSGLTLQSAGGDGIFLGPTLDSGRTPSQNVVIADCVCNDSLRQGLSIVSARHVTVEGCSFRNTRGTSPESGVEVEPTDAKDVIIDVEVRDSMAVNNQGSGFLASLTRLDATSSPVSLRFVNCRVLNTRKFGFRALLLANSNPRGSVEFINCTSEGTDDAGAVAVWNTAAPIKLRYQDCKWRRSSLRSSQSPMQIQLIGTAGSAAGGGIEFENCYVYDDQRRMPIRYVDLTSTGPSTSVSGVIHYINDQIDSTGQFGSEDLPRLSVRYTKRQR